MSEEDKLCFDTAIENFIRWLQQERERQAMMCRVLKAVMAAEQKKG